MKVIIINFLKSLLNLIEDKEVKNKSAKTSNKIKSNKRKRIKRNKWGFPIKY